MKIRLEDIGKRKSELEEKAKAKYKTERREIKEKIIDQLSRDEYHGILEMASKYNIKIPHDSLRKAADLYSKRDGSRSLLLAQWAYEQLEDKKTAKSLHTRIQRARDSERIRELARGMGVD